jgi:hypothetical protein
MDADDFNSMLDQARFRDRENRSTHPRVRLQKICTDAVQYRVNAQLGEEDLNKQIGRSLYSYLLQEMAKAASDYALNRNIDPDDFEIDGLGKALDVVDSLRFALVPNWEDKSLDFWHYDIDYNSPIDKIKAEKVPYFNRQSLEIVVGDYLALPYRSQAMDRLLVCVLIAMELYQFGDEMFNEKTFDLFPPRSPLKQRHVLLAYLRGQLLNAVFFIGIAALALWASSYRWVSESIGLWISGICVLLFLLSAGISTFALPFAWHKQASARQRVVKLFSTMATVYNDLKSDGPISAQYIRDRATNAAQEGVVWPGPLYALLDDIIARTGRF